MDSHWERNGPEPSSIDRNLVDDLAVSGGHHDVRRLHGPPLVGDRRGEPVSDGS